jgi:hypothetical protein
VTEIHGTGLWPRGAESEENFAPSLQNRPRGRENPRETDTFVDRSVSDKVFEKFYRVGDMEVGLRFRFTLAISQAVWRGRVAKTGAAEIPFDRTGNWLSASA